MNASRIALLENYMKEEPHDPFYPYALALELQHSDRDRARHLFNLLLVQFTDYLPAYYMAGAFFQQEDPERAEAIFKQGLALARKLNDGATHRELKAALDGLLG